jgi:hypothetical protein
LRKVRIQIDHAKICFVSFINVIYFKIILWLKLKQNKLQKASWISSTALKMNAKRQFCDYRNDEKGNRKAKDGAAQSSVWQYKIQKSRHRRGG